MESGDFLADTQTESSAAGFTIARAIDSIKTSKEFINCFLWIFSHVFATPISIVSGNCFVLFDLTFARSVRSALSS